MINYVGCNPTIDELYASRLCEDSNKQFKVSAEFKESPVTFSIILSDGSGKPDCKISSFHENIYFRTRNGLNYKKHKNVKSLERAIKNVSKKYGYTLEKLIIENGEPSWI